MWGYMLRFLLLEFWKSLESTGLRVPSRGSVGRSFYLWWLLVRGNVETLGQFLTHQSPPQMQAHAAFSLGPFSGPSTWTLGSGQPNCVILLWDSLLVPFIHQAFYSPKKNISCIWLEFTTKSSFKKLDMEPCFCMFVVRVTWQGDLLISSAFWPFSTFQLGELIG